MLGSAPSCREWRPFALTGLSQSATVRHHRPIAISWNWEHAGPLHSGACTRIPNLQFRLLVHERRSLNEFFFSEQRTVGRCAEKRLSRIGGGPVFPSHFPSHLSQSHFQHTDRRLRCSGKKKISFSERRSETTDYYS